jgi:hypothetical protein
MAGGFIVPVSGKSQIYTNSNFWFFVSKLLEADYPRARVETGDIGNLVGMKAFWSRIALPKRDIPGQTPDEKGRIKDILVVTQVFETGAVARAVVAAKSKTAAVRVGSAKAAPASAGTNGSGDLEDRVLALAIAAISDAGGQIDKKALAPMMMKNFEGKERPAAIAMVGKADFLDGHQELFLYDAENAVLIGV